MPTRTPRENAKPPSYPIWLSLLVLPGLGQLAQKRWLAALFFMPTFTVAAVTFIVSAFRIILRFYALAFSEGEELPAGLLPATGVFLLLSLVIYAASGADVYLAYLRQARAAAERRLQESLLA